MEIRTSSYFHLRDWQVGIACWYYKKFRGFKLGLGPLHLTIEWVDFLEHGN